MPYAALLIHLVGGTNHGHCSHLAAFSSGNIAGGQGVERRKGDIPGAAILSCIVFWGDIVIQVLSNPNPKFLKFF